MTAGNGNGQISKAIIGAMCTLFVLVVVGSFGYSMSIEQSQNTEKERWRSEHNRVLDRRFDEVKQGQEKIEKKVEQAADRTDELLREILMQQQLTNRHSSGGQGKRP